MWIITCNCTHTHTLCLCSVCYYHVLLFILSTTRLLNINHFRTLPVFSNHFSFTILQTSTTSVIFPVTYSMHLYHSPLVNFSILFMYSSIAILRNIFPFTTIYENHFIGSAHCTCTKSKWMQFSDFHVSCVPVFSWNTVCSLSR